MVGSDDLTGVWHTFTLTYSWTKVNSLALSPATWSCSQVSCSSRCLASMEVRCCRAWHEQFHLVKLSTVSWHHSLSLIMCEAWALIEPGITRSCCWYSFQWLSLGHGLLNISFGRVIAISLMRREMALLHYLGIIVESPRARALHISCSICVCSH